MIVGFTGTQVGMTEHQSLKVHELLGDTYNPVTEFHHGNCIGADEQAAIIALSLGIRTVAHPGDNPDKQSSFVSLITHAPERNLRRNERIVIACELLIATPKGPPQMRSGTWATIRYAGRMKRKTIIIKPDGEMYDSS
jgi:hypothetical protein